MASLPHLANNIIGVINLVRFQDCFEAINLLEVGQLVLNPIYSELAL